MLNLIRRLLNSLMNLIVVEFDRSIIEVPTYRVYASPPSGHPCNSKQPHRHRKELTSTLVVNEQSVFNQKSQSRLQTDYG